MEKSQKRLDKSHLPCKSEVRWKGRAFQEKEQLKRKHRSRECGRSQDEREYIFDQSVKESDRQELEGLVEAQLGGPGIPC